MKERVNASLRSSRAALEEEFKTKLEQEKVIWQAEHAAPASIKTDAPEPADHATPMKQQAEQPPSTPTTATPAAGGDATQLSDAESRKLLSTNPTLKSIFTANLKKKLEEHTVKTETTLRSEYEKKIATAREEGQNLASKKSALQISMKDNQVRAATAKIDVVKKAAEETPQRPVGEVWDEAKVAKPAPAPAPQGTPARPPAAAPAAATPGNAPATPAPASSLPKKPATPAPVAPSAQPTPANGPTTNNNTTPAVPPSVPVNPFAAAAAASNTGAAPANPFAAAAAQPGAQPAPAPAPAAQQNTQAGPRSAIPVPGRGGGATRGRGGTYQPPASRIPGAGPSERGNHAGRGRGRGGAQGINPGAAEFNPGSKRPRGDGDVGGGAKRARGGHH
ncbi:hypothetical protein F5X68DRAFT_147029 [Plectosphaerella plurivora]|uniref:Uncharacterized protein n=1 Tax=Plectosphaerella plurivora TaxID=936078 RepID=A0A9P8VKL3_9PEZI|nr:hypothetical protein F5X68DRAFT_147029 [Plectosphaerella plurivora]